MVSLDEILHDFHVVQLPMRTRFRGLMQREVALVRGPAGWAEWGPFAEYGPQEASHWLRCALEMGWNPSALPSAAVPLVPVNGTIPACDPAGVPALLSRYPGVQVVKIKVAEKGQRFQDDIARIRAVWHHRPEVNIRLDANGGWTVEQAKAHLRRLRDEFPDRLAARREASPAPAEGVPSSPSVKTQDVHGPATRGGFDYLEQPCPGLEDLARLREFCAAEGIAVRIAADESIRRAEDPARAIRMEAIDVAVVKAPPLGGPSRVRALAELAATHGIAVTVSSALDSAVGMYAGLCAAALSGSQPAGLATGQLFVDDVAPARRLCHGFLEARLLSPTPGALRRLAAPPERQTWWRERAAAAYEYLEE